MAKVNKAIFQFILFGVISIFNSGVVLALEGRTCCVNGSDPSTCNACDFSGTYWRNYDGDPLSPGECPADRPVGNACGDGNTDPTPTPVPPTPTPTPFPPAPDPLECYETCTLGSNQCRTPFTCATTSTGNRCVYPGYPEDSTCRQLPVCNSVCNTSEGCGGYLHTVKFVPDMGPQSEYQDRIWFSFDDVVDDGVYYNAPSSRLQYHGSWTFPFPYQAFSGSVSTPGTNDQATAATRDPRAYVTFTTTSKKIRWFNIVGPTVANVKVYIDNNPDPVAVINNYNINPYGGASPNSPVASPVEIVVEPEDNGYGCFNNICRLVSDPINQACLTCQGVSRNIQNPGFGDAVTYTVNPALSSEAIGRVVTYKGQCSVYRSGIPAPVRNFDLVANGNVFQPFLIQEAGASYQCRFQYCYTDPRDNREYCNNIGQ